MNLLVTYDVGTASEVGKRRLRQVARICEGYGQRVQYSVFEVTCSKANYVRLVAQLRETMEENEDSLRIYHFDRDGFDGVLRVGRQGAFHPDSPWTL